MTNEKIPGHSGLLKSLRVSQDHINVKDWTFLSCSRKRFPQITMMDTERKIRKGRKKGGFIERYIKQDTHINGPSWGGSTQLP